MVRFDDGHGIRDYTDGQDMYDSDDFDLDTDKPDKPVTPVEKEPEQEPELEPNWKHLVIPPMHKHLHAFSFKLNNVNTLIRGCITCGRSWGTLVMGEPDDLIWHPIYEPEEPGDSVER